MCSLNKEDINVKKKKKNDRILLVQYNFCVL